LCGGGGGWGGQWGWVVFVGESEGVRERGREGEKDPNTDVMSSFS